MSLKSLCELHTCTLHTLSVTEGAGFGKVRDFTAAAYNQKCRIVPLSADKIDTFNKIGMEVDYQVFFVYNPRTKVSGEKVRRITFTDENGDTRTLDVLGEKNPDQMNRFWRYDCREYTARENR